MYLAHRDACPARQYGMKSRKPGSTGDPRKPRASTRFLTAETSVFVSRSDPVRRTSGDTNQADPKNLYPYQALSPTEGSAAMKSSGKAVVDNRHTELVRVPRAKAPVFPELGPPGSWIARVCLPVCWMAMRSGYRDVIEPSDSESVFEIARTLS